MVLAEAMCAGCAVVTTNVGACVSTVGDQAILVVPKNSVRLKEAIKYLIDNEEKMYELQTGGLVFVEEYDWRKVMLGYVKEIRSILA
jgi:glycosyltransferase involved in cell wall biosynthesis